MYGSEYNTIEESVDDLVDGIDGYLEDIEQVADLKSRLGELREEKERLADEIAELERECDELAQKKMRLSSQVAGLEEEKGRIRGRPG